MGRFIVIALLLASLVGCITPKGSRLPNPAKDVCFFVIDNHDGMPIPMCFEKGVFDLSEEEREFKIFGSIEDLLSYLNRRSL